MTMFSRAVASGAVGLSLILAATGGLHVLTLVTVLCTAGSLAFRGPGQPQVLVARVCAAAGVIAGVMALLAGILPQLALPLLVLAVAAACLATHRNTAADALALVAASSLALALGGYALHFRPYFATKTQTMSLPTVVVLILLCFAVLLRHPGRGLIAYIRNHGTAGRIARYLLPIPFLLPYVLSAVTTYAIEHRAGDPIVIFWAFALANTAGAALLIFAAVRRLDEAELARLAAQEQLQRTNDELERRVQERTAELARTNAALEATNAELEQFAYLSAHDLQEPLRIVRVYAQLLELRAPDLSGEMREHLDTVIGAAERMQVLVRDVQTYSQALHASPAYGDVPLTDVVQGAIQRVAGIILAANAAVTCDDLPIVRGSAEQLEIVFVHLLTNAVRFRSADQPQVRISGTIRDGECEIAVTDNGVGIGPEYHGRIFGLFKRLRSGTEGTGLGLALCRRIVTAHGGRIWVRSELGRGATFYFTLSAAGTDQQPAHSANP